MKDISNMNAMPLLAAGALLALCLAAYAEAGVDSEKHPPYPAREDVPVAPIGRKKAPSALDQYYAENGRGDDPEFESVYRGRREVDLIADYSLAMSFESPDQVARAILDAIETNDAGRLHELRLSFDEFRDLVWYEFPASRPVTNITPEDGYFSINANSEDGVNELLATYAGVALEFQWLEYEAGRSAYTNFELYRGVAIHTLTPGGDEVVIREAITFLERNGEWKLFQFKS